MTRGAAKTPGKWISLGTVVLLTLCSAAYLAFGVVGVRLGEDPAHIRMNLSNAAGISVASPVLSNGIRVGAVTAVGVNEHDAWVDFVIDADRQVPVDSTVTIETLSGLGEPFIRFSPRSGTAPFLTDGAVVDTANIVEPLSVSEVSQLLTTLMAQLDPDELSRLIATLDTAVRGTEQTMPSLARSATLVSGVVDSRLAEIGVTYRQLQDIAASSSWLAWAGPAAAPPFVRFAGRVDEIANALYRLFDAGSGDPMMYVRPPGLVPTMERMSGWMNQVGPEIAPLVPVLKPLTDDLADSVPRVDLSRLIHAAVESTTPGALSLRIYVR